MSDTETVSWLIELRLSQATEAMTLRIDERLVFGRADKNQDTKVDVDLTPFGAEEHGVSRQHMMIHIENDRLMITDLNSGNGTFVNNTRLEPQKPHPLEHDDRLRLGEMEMNVRVVISPTYGSTVHKRKSLQVQEEIQPGRGQLVLIVEDDPAIARFLALVMKYAGYTTQTASDVIGTIRIFNQKQPSAVIMDVMLPGVDGREFCRYVRRDVQRNTVPIIAISANSSEENARETMKAGADVFLTKPLSAKELTQVVTSLIMDYERGVSSLQTKHLVGTAPLKSIKPESRRNSAVLFVAGHNESPITVHLSQPVSFGRTSPVKGNAHIDLTRFDAIERGVSREHMSLHYQSGQFFVEDNGSVNGTYVNGEPIKPHELNALNNSDEIRLGQLRMYIYFLINSEEEAG